MVSLSSELPWLSSHSTTAWGAIPIHGLCIEEFIIVEKLHMEARGNKKNVNTCDFIFKFPSLNLQTRYLTCAATLTKTHKKQL